MTQSGTNTLRTVFTIILMGCIAILVYILSQKNMNQTDELNVGVASPVATVNTAPAPRGVNAKPDIDQFNDGLRQPNRESNKQPDEYGVGITNVRIYNRDLNNDGRPDRITRTHIENGTSHFTNEYKIELATNNGYINITPDDLKTIEGADCALQKLRFYFDPEFTIEKIGRTIGETYTTPTMAYKIIYKMRDNKLIQISRTPLTTICDVSGLFN